MPSKPVPSRSPSRPEAIPAWPRTAAWLLLSLAWFCGSAQAVNVADLLRAETLVMGQDAKARAAGFRDTMEQVLVKLSGNSAIGEVGGLDSYLGSASRYVQQYRYRALQPLLEPDPDAADPSPTETAIPVPTHVLEVEFAEAPLLRVMENLGIPVWGRERPQIMLWVAVENGAARYLLGSDSGDVIADLLRKHAARLGVPVLLPLMDVEDQAAVDVADVRGGFHERLVQAARRYGVDRVLVATLTRGRGRVWDGQWTLYTDGEISNWGEPALDPDQVVARGMQGLAAKLASLYAVRRTDQVIEVVLRVEDVRELEDYGSISRFLTELALTRRVQLRRVTADTLEFSLQVQGSQPDLERALALSSHLYASDDSLQSLFDQPEEAVDARQPGLPQLVYRYRP